jgi:hypothetical protein
MVISSQGRRKMPFKVAFEVRKAIAGRPDRRA